ncbi:alpha-(1-_3)-arabinofuranosyltransferase domain-containing protein [Nonomuraea endophytica]|uniref:alpha-(1->3)-arabinofuranosyltransferase domain-containing protein n=1 Tax=Nonomuraea endophytica TaxID=714136 RepID=UPI0037CB80D3
MNDTPVSGRARHRLWLAICCLGFAVLAFTTSPGDIIADTKIDLALNPVGWLERLAHLWDLQHFGQLQNQVAGYLFPMGPFFALGELIGLDPWVTQRLWLTLLMCVAFLGVERLARQLGIGNPGTRVAGALAYALAPRVLSIIGEISAEWLPAAMLPWILLPLLTAAETGQRARAAIRSGLAVALCGGVNAVAVLAVLIAPVLYILTRPKPVPRWRMLAWWSGAVGVATLFWWLPLLLVGRYAFSFLPYTETSTATTQVTSLTNVLRGASDWVRFLTVNGVETQPASFAIATSALMIVVTGVIAALGLAGLAHRDLPARGFVIALFLVGVTALTAGHMSALEPVVAEPVRWLLDGPLAPLRNLRKFDPLVRLPLALGLAHLLVKVRLPVKAVAATAFACLVLPVFNVGLGAPGHFKEVPLYWRQAAAWVNENAGGEGVLVVPGAKFGEYLWGRPMDDPMQPMFAARWTTRQVTAAGSIGLSRLLDAVDQRFAAGHGSPGLTEVLRRMGVRYLLVRNDLNRAAIAGAYPSRIYEALRESPGITRLQSFGGEVGDTKTDDAENSVDWPFPALDLYEVSGSSGAVGVLPAGDALAVRGGPDSLLSMGDLGLLGDSPVLVNGDAGTREAPTVVSDALRLRERHFGEIRSNWTQTLTADQREDFTGVRALDLLEAGWLDDTATAEYEGVSAVTASSSAADSGAVPGISSSGRSPWAALDGDYETNWETSGWKPPAGEWLRLDFPAERTLPGMKVTFTNNVLLGQSIKTVAVETENGRIVQDVQQTNSPQSLRIPPGTTGWVRIKVVATTSRSWNFVERVGISEIAIPGLLPGRTIRLPQATGDVYVMDRGVDERPRCMRNQARWICNPLLERPGEEGAGFDRTFTAAAAAKNGLTGFAVLRDPALVDRYTRLTDDLPSVKGTSQVSKDPVVAPRSAFDADAGTTWIPAGPDAEPALTIGWKKPKTISRIQIARPGGDKEPLDVIVSGDKGATRGARVDAGGNLVFKPMTTRTLKLRFFAASRRLQVTELIIPGVTPASRPEGIPFRLGCGQGPTLQLNGKPVQTKVSGTYADLLEQRPVRFVSCAKAAISPGANRVRIPGWEPWGVSSLMVGSLQPGSPAVAGAAVQGTWTPSLREVRVTAPKDSFLIVNENFNEGWRAELDGQTLRPVRIDGWKQAWELPAGTTGTVRLEYGPDRTYWLALAAGLAGIAALALLALVMRGPRPEHVLQTAPAHRSRLDRWRVPYVIVLGLAFGGWVASWPGMAAVLATTALVLLTRLHPTSSLTARTPSQGRTPTYGRTTTHGRTPTPSPDPSHGRASTSPHGDTPTPTGTPAPSHIHTPALPHAHTPAPPHGHTATPTHGGAHPSAHAHTPAPSPGHEHAPVSTSPAPASVPMRGSAAVSASASLPGTATEVVIPGQAAGGVPAQEVVADPVRRGGRIAETVASPWLGAVLFVLAAAAVAAGIRLDLPVLADQVAQLIACAAMGALFGALVTVPPRRAPEPEVPAVEQELAAAAR